MGAQRTANRLPPEVAGYVAGLIDGEGTITLSRLHAGERRRLVVSIVNTELPMLRFIAEQAGVGKITRKRTTSDRHTPAYTYAVTSRQALQLLEQIVQYLRSYKRQRAMRVLQLYTALTPRNGKYTPELSQQREAFEMAFLELRAGRG
jgi:hypothetical protein